jgi:hypothetical protein
MANHAISQHVTASLPSIPTQPTAAEQSQGSVYPLPGVKPGFRLVPARVETKTSSTIVYIECPMWCAVDHVDESVGAVEDVMHLNEGADVYVPTFGYGVYPVQLHAWIESDPVAMDPSFKAAHIVVGDASGDEGSHITPEMAEKLADDLIGFASELRHMARTARQANASARVSLRKPRRGVA